jgi:hypothetical protein
MGIEINIPDEGENGLSVIVDPFLSDSLESLSINYRKNSFSKDTYWYANVVFQNGNTKGEQRLGNCETFEEIVIQVKHLLNEIKNKSNG